MKVSAENLATVRERYDEALADFSRANELDPSYRPPQRLGFASV